MKCAALGEFGLIARLTKNLPRSPFVVAGVGDDAAVLRTNDRHRFLLFTTDPVVEGVHFIRKKRGHIPAATPFQIGWKAMARNLSDIAAMGGLPRWAVISLGLPRNESVKFVDDIYRGLNQAAARWGVAIVGGDTSKTHGPLFVSVALIGEVEKKFLKLRSTARPGQIVFVTETLGGSLLGKHLKFTPRIEEARWLVRNFPVAAMMDVSDGLGSDLRRLADVSRVGFQIFPEKIPISVSARQLARRDGKSPLRHAWSDGEDFELLFTVPKNVAEKLQRQWRRKFKLPLTPIGVVTKRGGIVVEGGGLEGAKGYEHF